MLIKLVRGNKWNPFIPFTSLISLLLFFLHFWRTIMFFSSERWKGHPYFVYNIHSFICFHFHPSSKNKLAIHSIPLNIIRVLIWQSTICDLMMIKEEIRISFKKKWKGIFSIACSTDFCPTVATQFEWHLIATCQSLHICTSKRYRMFNERLRLKC